MVKEIPAPPFTGPERKGLLSLRGVKLDLPLDFDSFKRQESTLVLLNLAVIASLFLVHVVFLSFLGAPSRALLIVLSVRFLMLCLELIWLQDMQGPPGRTHLFLYVHSAIWLNIVFAFLVTVPANNGNTHYSVLFLLPVISAAFWLSLAGTLTIVGVAVSLTLLQVWLFFRAHPPVDMTEVFEAATVSLIFIVVGAIVWLLAQHLRRNEAAVRKSVEELGRARDRLISEEKLAAIGRLSSSIAHEIRNPVAIIAASLSTATREKAPAALSQEMFQIAGQEAARLEKLTADFLAYARSKEPLQMKTQLAPLLGYIAGIMKVKGEEAGFTVAVQCDDDLVASIDSDQIQRALLNLMLNAADATPARGSITIGAYRCAGDVVKIFVEDSGDQLSDAVSARIFEPFFTTKPWGTGLGLAIVRNIASAHAGDVALENNAPGRVRFVLTIPEMQVTPPFQAGGTNGSNTSS
jgi:signal transduction histidine kinase